MSKLSTLTKPTRKYAGFTLVELIVVITILVILGTIAFISLGGYSLSARDSTRISNLNNLHKGLSVFQIKAGTYPMPEGPITLTASGPIIGYQGFAKELTESIAKLSPGATKDPLDPTIYTTYSVNQNQTKMQLMNFLENGSTATAYTDNIPNFIPTTFANITSDYSKRTPSTKGDTLGILLGNTGTTLNQPVQESYNVSSFTGVDVVNTSTGYSAVFSKTTTTSGTGVSLITAIATNSPDGKNISENDNSLVGYWDMESKVKIGNRYVLKDLSSYGNNGYCYDGITQVDCGDALTGPKITTLSNGNKGMKFDGINDWIKIPGTQSINENTRTILVFSKRTSGWSINQKFGGAVPGNLLINSGWGASTYDNTPLAQNITLPGAYLGKWLHYSIIQKRLPTGGSYLGSYEDGIFKQKFDNFSTTFASWYSWNMYLGARDLGDNDSDPNYAGNNGNQAFFSGEIDEIRIYNRALSDSEILSLYNTIK